MWCGMEKNEICNRDMRLDTIRAIAITFVIAIHAFSWIGFYEEPITGKYIWCYLYVEWLLLHVFRYFYYCRDI